jgi:hypothetical protein
MEHIYLQQEPQLYLSDLGTVIVSFIFNITLHLAYSHFTPDERYRLM